MKEGFIFAKKSIVNNAIFEVVPETGPVCECCGRGGEETGGLVFWIHGVGVEMEKTEISTLISRLVDFNTK